MQFRHERVAMCAFPSNLNELNRIAIKPRHNTSTNKTQAAKEEKNDRMSVRLTTSDKKFLHPRNDIARPKSGKETKRKNREKREREREKEREIGIKQWRGARRVL